MTKQINWVSLSLNIIGKQDETTSNGKKTVRYIQSHIDTLLDKGKLTEAQSANLIRNIDIHLGITIPAQIVAISSKTARRWKAKGIATQAPKAIQTLTLEDHWQALIAHYGDMAAVAHAACDRIEGTQATQTAPAPQEAVQTPLDRKQQVTVSIWEGTGSGNLDYKDGRKEHIVFQRQFADARKKLEEAGAPDSLWRSLSIALDGKDNHDVQYGVIHGDKDPKGKKAVSNPDCIVIKAIPHGRPDKFSVTFVQSAYPMTALAGTDKWTKRKSSHPDIKGYIEGLAA